MEATIREYENCRFQNCQKWFTSTLNLASPKTPYSSTRRVPGAQNSRSFHVMDGRVGKQRQNAKMISIKVEIQLQRFGI